MANTKYNKKIADNICKVIMKDTYTIAEICQIVGISEACYYKWQRDRQDFKDAIAQARDNFDENLITEAKRAFRKIVNGYEAEEVKTTYINGKDGKPQIKERVVFKKHFKPEVHAVVFMLEKKCPEFAAQEQKNNNGGITFELIQGVTELDKPKNIE